MQSFINVHIECKRALPGANDLVQYGMLLHKMDKLKLPKVEWTALNFQQLVR